MLHMQHYGVPMSRAGLSQSNVLALLLGGAMFTSTAHAASTPVIINWETFYGTGTDVVTPGDRIYMIDQNGGCGQRDIASCETAEDGSISAYYKDSCGEGDQGEWVQEGCSEASELGYTISCCHEKQDRIISYQYASHSSDEVEIGAELVELTDAITVRDQWVDGGHDHVICDTNAAGQVQASNKDRLGNGSSVKGHWVSEGCSIAADQGWLLSCCIEDFPVAELEDRIADAGYSYVEESADLSSSGLALSSGECTTAGYAVDEHGLGVAEIACNDEGTLGSFSLYVREDLSPAAEVDLYGLQVAESPISILPAYTMNDALDLDGEIEGTEYSFEGPTVGCTTTYEGVCLGADLVLVKGSWGFTDSNGNGVTAHMGAFRSPSFQFDGSVLSGSFSVGVVSISVSVDVKGAADMAMEHGGSVAGAIGDFGEDVSAVTQDAWDEVTDFFDWW